MIGILPTQNNNDDDLISFLFSSCSGKENMGPDNGGVCDKF